MKPIREYFKDQIIHENEMTGTDDDPEEMAKEVDELVNFVLKNSVSELFYQTDEERGFPFYAEGFFQFMTHLRLYIGLMNKLDAEFLYAEDETDENVIQLFCERWHGH